MGKIRKNGIFVVSVQFLLLFLFSLSLLAQTSSQSRTSSSQSSQSLLEDEYWKMTVHTELPFTSPEDMGFLFWNMGARVKGGKCGKKCRKTLKRTGYKIFKDACKRGNAKGCRLLGLYLLLEEKRPVQGKKFLVKGCVLGDPWSCMSALSLYLAKLTKENARETIFLLTKLDEICEKYRGDKKLKFQACSMAGRVWDKILSSVGKIRLRAKMSALNDYAHGCMYGEAEDIISYHRLCLKGARLAFQLDKIKEAHIKDLNYKRLGCDLLFQAISKPVWFYDFKVQDLRKNPKQRHRKDELFRVTAKLSCDWILTTRTYRALVKEIEHNCGEFDKLFEKFKKYSWKPSGTGNKNND